MEVQGGQVCTGPTGLGDLGTPAPREGLAFGEIRRPRRAAFSGDRVCLDPVTLDFWDAGEPGPRADSKSSSRLLAHRVPVALW